ncbi:hypothetical protein PIB30_039126 [Stylosanthes scabra]|uniref:Uncharacterized protein n=1 Tax=Stylosanthes scabra TaxID=79078 RepID=A0ABU6SE27_9FABA|nr:hypothetical protein [Stylosanthes scabra]
MVQPDDDALPAEQPMNAGRRKRAAGRGRGRGASRGDGSPARAADHVPAAPVDYDVVDFDPEMTAADYMSIGLAIPSQPFPDASTPDIDFTPENYTQWVADMIGQSSYQPPPDVPYRGTPIQHTEPFAHMSAETPPTAYAPRRQDPSESSSSGEQQIRHKYLVGLVEDRERHVHHRVGQGLS